VHALACSAAALASMHVRPVSRRPWSASRHLMACDLCSRTWVRGTPAAHADYCAVGRTVTRAERIIALGPGRKELGDFLLGTPPTGLYEARETGDLRRELNSLSHERSEASGSTVSRAGEGRSGLALESEGAYGYQEPWAWDRKLGVVVNPLGQTVANMILVDLSVLEQEQFGRRIVACVNFCRGMSNGELRAVDEAVTRIREVMAAAGDEQDALLEAMATETVQ
jgi:hypothetical protein